MGHRKYQYKRLEFPLNGAHVSKIGVREISFMKNFGLIGTPVALSFRSNTWCVAAVLFINDAAEDIPLRFHPLHTLYVYQPSYMLGGEIVEDEVC